MNAKGSRLPLSEAIRQAIARLENDYPQFKSEDYAPPAEGEERKHYEEYRALDDARYREFQNSLLRHFVKQQRAKNELVASALDRAGLAPTEAQVSDEPAPAPEASRSIKIERGEECAKVICELEFLKTHIRKSHTTWSFPALKQHFPSFRVLEILSEARFDHEDRDTVCYPNVWVYPVGYGRTILAKYFKVKNETIRSYLKSFGPRYKLKPPPK